MPAKKKNDGYDEPNPLLGSAREAAEAAAAAEAATPTGQQAADDKDKE